MATAGAAAARRVLVYGGNGSLGSAIVNFFKTKNVVRFWKFHIRFMQKLNIILNIQFWLYHFILGITSNSSI